MKEKKMEIEKIYPLSPMQSGMLFHSLMNEKVRAYFERIELNIKGEVDAVLLEESFNILVKRYDVLRTRFVHKKIQEPKQVVLKHIRIPFYYDDLTLLSENKAKIYLEEWKAKDLERGFDLTKDILMRFFLFKTGEGYYRLMWSFHHIVMDGWCLGIVFKEFVQIYCALKGGNSLALAPVVPYKIYIEWLESRDKKEGLRYWQEYLSDYEQCTGLSFLPLLSPTVGHTASSDEYKAQEYEVFIDGVLRQGLEEIARCNKVTVNTVFQTIWGILLQKYNNTDDVVFGVVVSGRSPDIDGIEQMVGLFINTILFRVKREDAADFSQLLKKVHRESMSSRPYEYIPLAEVQANHPLKNELIDHIMAFENYPLAEELKNLRFDPGIGFQVEDVKLFEQTNYNLNVVVSAGKSFSVRFSFNSLVYNLDFIKRVSLQVITLLRQVVENPGIPLEDMEIVTVKERKRLLFDFNDTEAGYPADKTIRQLFEEQADRNGDSTAVVCGERRADTRGPVTYHLTYRKLNEKTDQLACLLREKGVQPDIIVAIMMECSPEMIIGIIGILKAGGVYLPIDPDYPQERIGYMLADSKVNILVKNSNIISDLKNKQELFVLNFEHLDFEFVSNFDIRISDLNASNLAYVIYTSGTTGKPKGTLIEHRNVVRLMFNDRFLFEFDSMDVWTMFHSYCFDFSVWEMYGALLYGGKLVLIPRMVAKDPRGYLEILKREQVTVLNQTPSAFYNLAQEEIKSPGKKLHLKYVIFGGEALAPFKLKRWREKYPGTKLVNMFGITETTVHVTYKEIREKDIELNISNIGKPIPTLTTYVMDNDLKLLPVGVPGELLVGGKGVGRGYLNQVDSTSEKFVENGRTKSERLYRSGDLARLLENGDLEYLGRIDHQVKVRGFRIELGEIQYQLSTHEEIKEAVVLERKDGNGGRSLCAYVVSQRKLIPSELREYLLNKLPDYMVPSYFVFLDKMPLTPNGKIDRKLLLAVDMEVESGWKTSAAPRNEMEEKLVQVWESVLKVKVGITASFFEIGGDSIKAIRLLNQVNETCNTNLQIVDIFTHDTIEKLSVRINQGSPGYSDEDLKNVLEEIEELKNRIARENDLPGDIEDIYPMSDIEKGMLYYSLKDREQAVYHDQMVYLMEYDDFSPGRFKKAFLLLVEKHPILRTALNLDDYGEPLQLVYGSIFEDIDHIDISDKGKDQQEAYLNKFLQDDRRRPFDPAIPPLCRLRTFRLDDKHICLILVNHHAILDGWSVASLVTELDNTYHHLEKNGDFVPTKLKSTYKEYIVQQILEKERGKAGEYWKKELEGYKRLDFSGKLRDALALLIKSSKFNLGTQFLEKLENTAKNHNTTVKNLCFGAFVLAFNMFSYENDIVVGLVTNNRPLCEDGEKILGCFLNTLPFRMKIPPVIRGADYIGMIEKKMLELKHHERLSLFEILKVIGEHTREENPLFDIVFNFIDFHVYQQVYHADSPDRGNEEGKLAVEGYVNTNTMLNFTVNTTFRAFELIFHYTQPVFSDADIRILSKYFENVLISFVNESAHFIRKEKIMPVEERQRLLLQFNSTGVDYLAGQTIQRLFEDEAGKRPGKVAVVFDGDISTLAGNGNQQVAYGELNARANRLARALREKGVKPGSIVALLVEPSIEMIIGIMAVLKAGGAYLAIDPEFPENRITYMLHDSNVQLLLTQAQMVDTLDFRGQTVNIDDNRWWEEESVNLQNINSPTDQVYVIYTSGTTGKPKGVLLKHKNLVNYVHWLSTAVNLTAEDRAILTSSFAFDLGYSSIFPSILKGCELHAVPKEFYLLPENLLKYIKIREITYLKLTPSLLTTIVHHPDFSVETCSSLRFILLGGEAIHLKDVEQLHLKCNHINVMNHYGPTEATIGSVARFIDFSRFDEYQMSPTIGKPIHNTNVYILDSHRDLLPVGVAGELWIGGDGVGKGYLNQPGLTYDRFVRNPFPGGGLIYSTGDLAKWHWDGNIEFLGRIDSQVKVRGYRIELGEIENRLLNHPGIREALVIVSNDEKGGKYLAAYVVPEKGGNTGTLEAVKLREYLAEELPEYMIPSYFVPLEELPLTPNGKIDRKALSEADKFTATSDSGYIAPRTEIEEKMVEVWEKVLGRNRVGVNDNFFLIGGDSIKAIQIVSKLSKVGYKTTIKDIFRNASISRLVSVIKKSKRTAEQSVITGTIPMIPIQMEFFSYLKIDRHHYNQAVMLYSAEPMDEEAVRAVFIRIQKHHDILRTTFKEFNGRIVQVNHGLDYPFSLQKYDLRKRENPVEALEEAANEIQGSIDLERGPMMKLGLFRLDDGDRLLMVIHHLVIDTVSWRILLEDIETLYQQYQKGEQMALPEKTDSFKLWAEKLVEYANSEEFLKEKSFWIKLESLDVPAMEKDFQENNNCMRDTDTLSFCLSEEETDQLLTKVNHAFGTEVNDILLTALALGVRKAFGNTHALIALEGHGREEIIADVDISRTVGWFTSVYPVILDAYYADDLSRQIKEIKESLRRLPKKGIGYGILKYLTDDAHKKDIKFRLKPQISFNYLGQFDADREKLSLGRAEEAAGYTRGLNVRRKYELDIVGIVIDKKLQISIIYNKKQYKSETLDRLMAHFKEQLEKIIAFCQARNWREPTPSDFFYKDLSIETLDHLSRQYPLEDIYPLGPMQEGMLFHSLYDNSTHSYTGLLSFRYHGKINIDVVRQSLNELCKRHDVLRTAFIIEGVDRPLQVVLKERHVDFFFKDIRQLEKEEKEVFIDEIKEKNRQRPFDLSKDVLMRITILQLSEALFEFIWTYHHMIKDGWSSNIIINEYFEIYNSCIEKRPYQLPEAAQFKTYIKWLAKQDTKKTKNFWTKYLYGYKEITSIPKISAFGGKKVEYQMEAVYFSLDAQQKDGLDKLAERYQVTLSIIIQVIWGIILAKYNNKDDVVFGLVVLGRPTEIAGIENGVGVFINTVPVRIGFGNETNFKDLLLNARDNAIESELYHYYSLAEIQATSELKRNLIDHILVFFNEPPDYAGTSKIDISNSTSVERSNYDLDVHIFLYDQISFKIKYNGKIYDGSLMKKIPEHFKEIIDQVIENPEVRFNDIGMSYSYDLFTASTEILQDNEGDFVF